MLNIILFGPPGSGKGTQAENLVKTYGLLHTSTGDLLRDEISRETPLGMEAKKFMNKGLLVPDEVVIGMISNRLDENDQAKGFIFDGFPRTVAQAEALDNLLKFKNTSIKTVLELVVDEEELIRRILKRGATSNRADDKDESVIRKRIVEYREKTAPVADYYGEKGKLARIKGTGSIDETFYLLKNEMEAIL